ncbi:MAG: DUF3576 domain-containing protein [Thiohalocapsa sp.]
MSIRHYHLLLGFAASLSLLVAGCGSPSVEKGIDPVTGAAPTPLPGSRTAADTDNTDETIFTVLGLAKRQSEVNWGPQTGAGVSPILWVAAHDALNFAGISSEDAMTGLLVTNWHSPPSNPSERLRVSVFITSRALRSDSLAVSVERQERAADGQWHTTPVAKDVVTGLENAILLRARQLHAERYRSTM